MRVIFLAVFVVSTLLAFAAVDLLGAEQKGKPKGKPRRAWKQRDKTTHTVTAAKTRRRTNNSG